MMPFFSLSRPCSPLRSPLLRDGGLIGSRDRAVSRLLPTHVLQLQELDGAHGAVQPYAGFQPQEDAQGAAICSSVDMSIRPYDDDMSICPDVEMLPY